MRAPSDTSQRRQVESPLWRSRSSTGSRLLLLVIGGVAQVAPHVFRAQLCTAGMCVFPFSLSNVFSRLSFPGVKWEPAAPSQGLCFMSIKPGSPGRNGVTVQSCALAVHAPFVQSVKNGAAHSSQVQLIYPASAGEYVRNVTHSWICVCVQQVPHRRSDVAEQSRGFWSESPPSTCTRAER